MPQSSSLWWRLSCAGAVLLSAITFTPLVIPYGVHKPMLAGMPLTLWAGILVAVGLVFLTYVGSRVHPSADEGRPEAGER